MVKRGKIGTIDGYAIQGAIHSGKTVEEIAELVDRSVKQVDTYVKGTLSDIHSAVANAKLQAGEENQDVPELDYEDIEDLDAVPEILEDRVTQDQVASRTMQNEVFRRLRSAGLTEKDTNQVMAMALRSAIKMGKRYKSGQILYTACIKRMNAGHFIQKQTEGGRGGIAIMSSAASSRMDEARKKAPKGRSRSARGAIYNPSTGEIE